MLTILLFLTTALALGLNLAACSILRYTGTSVAGSGCTVTITVSGGGITAVTGINSNGSSYPNSTTVPLTVVQSGGANGIILATTNGVGQVVSATVLVPGTGYSATSNLATINGGDVTNINNRVDAADLISTADTSNPITVPGSGTNYSYWSVMRFYCNTAPSTLINNLNLYTAGGTPLNTGWGCVVGQATSYIQATGSTGDGTQLTTGNYSTLTGAPSNIFGYTSGSPLAISGSTTTTGPFGNYVVYQFTVGSTASAGTSGSPPTLTFTFDEE